MTGSSKVPPSNTGTKEKAKGREDSHEHEDGEGAGFPCRSDPPRAANCRFGMQIGFFRIYIQ